MPGESTHDLAADEISRISDPPTVTIAPGAEWASNLLTRHMPGLDLLRGTAIVFVLFFHGFYFSFPFFPWHSPVARALFAVTSVGWTGVNLFFVLSGFLITGNLADSEQKPNFYARFYLRRALRILPLYFAVLLVLWAARLASGNFLLLCVVFLANMPGVFLPRGAWLGFPPLWSLAVEEQFYLAWPWLYRTLRARGMAILCGVCMLVCPLLRAAALHGWFRTGDVFSKTWMIADNLAIGALLAILLRHARIRRVALVRFAWAAATISAAGLLLFAAAGATIKTTVLGGSLGFTLIEWLCASVLVLLLDRFRARPLPGGLRWLVFFGDISYGLYLWHMLCEELYDRYLSTAVPPGTVHGLWTRFLFANGVAIAVATVSKRWFENPILHLKERMPAAR